MAMSYGHAPFGRFEVRAIQICAVEAPITAMRRSSISKTACPVPKLLVTKACNIIRTTRNCRCSWIVFMRLRTSRKTKTRRTIRIRIITRIRTRTKIKTRIRIRTSRIRTKIRMVKVIPAVLKVLRAAPTIRIRIRMAAVSPVARMRVAPTVKVVLANNPSNRKKIQAIARVTSPRNSRRRWAR